MGLDDQARLYAERLHRADEKLRKPNGESDWRDQLQRQKKRLKSNLLNLALILEHDPVLAGMLRMNEFANRIEVVRSLPFRPTGRTDWCETDSSEACAWLENQYGWAGGSGKVHEAVCMVAARHAYHPVRDYLDALAWDGIERWPTLFEDFFGAEPSEFLRTLAPCWGIAAVARVYTPGCMVNYMPILEGEQQIGKSFALRVLFEPWYAEATESPANKDFYQALIGKWGIEIGELDSFKRAETTRVKQAITTVSDYYRPSYGRLTRDFPRQCVFAGTTNEHKYLHDATGGARFMPVRCTAVNVEGLQGVRSQLWAEAVHRFRAGASWWAIPRDLASREQESRYMEDSWEEIIEAWVEGRPRVTVQEVLSHALDILPAKQDRAAQTRVGVILRRLGWMPRQATMGGIRARYYEPKRE